VKVSELRTKAKAWLRAKYPDALITHEFSVAEYGGALVDVAAILPDQIIGIEIKGEGDSPTRLGLQGGMYSRVCRTMYLLADESIQKRCLAARPLGWGELLIDNGRADYTKYELCPASGLMHYKYSSPDKTGYGLAAAALAAMPWTKEYPAFSAALGYDVTHLRKSDCIGFVMGRSSVRAIEKAVCAVLMKREWDFKEVEAGEVG